MRRRRLMSLPPLLVFDFNNQPSINIDHHLAASVDGVNARYDLKGVIYFGNHHFTSRWVSTDGTVWFHDGMVTQPRMIRGSHIDSFDRSALNRWGDLAVLTAALYVRL